MYNKSTEFIWLIKVPLNKVLLTLWQLSGAPWWFNNNKEAVEEQGSSRRFNCANIKLHEIRTNKK